VKPVYSSPVRASPARYSSPVRVRTATLLESPVVAALNRSYSVERRLSPVYVSPSRYARYYDYDLPYYTGLSKYYPYTSVAYPYSPLAYPYARYGYPYDRYAPYGSYYSATLGRYIAY
jgi:hypothetical protein